MGKNWGPTKGFSQNMATKFLEIGEINEQRNITIEDSNDNYKHDDVKIKWTILYPRIQLSLKPSNLMYLPE